MSDVVNQGAICPGQMTLMDNGDKHFLRVVFMCYWMNGQPSTEVFYVTDHPIRLNPTSIEAFEKDVLELMHNFSETRAMKLTYIGYSGIEMSPSDVTAAGWHMIMGAVSAEDN